jgi:pimeloyl-ACP methyl ester carboxylesterase
LPVGVVMTTVWRGAPWVGATCQPTALTWFPADLGALPPRSWIERRYNLTRYTVMPRGGHFAPVEEPDLLAEQIEVFFREIDES